MTATTNWRHYARLQADWRALLLVTLFTAVLLAALYARSFFVAAPGVESVTTGTSTAQQAAGGVGLSIFTTIEAGILLALLALFRRTPEWLQPVIRRTIRIAFWVGAALVLAMAAGVHAGFSLAVLAYFAIQLADGLGVYWVINDLLALGLAIYFAAVAGILVGPVVLGVALVGLSVYDHVFANRKQWMFSLARSAVRWKLPGLLVIPTTLRLSWDELADFTTDEEDSPIGFGIGMADLALPSAFAVALVTADSVMLYLGAGLGIMVACLHLSWTIQNTGSGAGLPPLAAGAIGGWAVAALVGVLA